MRRNYYPAPVPYRLLFYLTSRCNCRCHNCLIWQAPAHPELSTGEIRQVLINSASHLRWLHLSGGEIFLRDDIDEIIRVVAQHLPRLYILQIATNCTLPDRVLKVCQILKKSRIPKSIFTLSLDGVGSRHDEARGVPGLFDRVINLYREIKQHFSPVIEPYLGFTITRSNVEQLPENIRTLHYEYGVESRDIHYNFYHQSDIYYQNDASEVPTPEQARRIIPYLNALPTGKNHLSPENILERRYRRLYLDFLKTGRSPLKCEAFSGSLSITSSGECYPCMGYPRSAGSIKDYNFCLADLWRSTTVKTIRSSIEKYQCPQCWTPCEAFQTMLTHSLPGHKS
jgi:MoaA/NifB/PqqE/SkfB family radical SAM enzyme